MGLLERLGLRRERKVYLVLRGLDRRFMGIAFTEEKANSILSNVRANCDKRTPCWIEECKEDRIM